MRFAYYVEKKALRLRGVAQLTKELHSDENKSPALKRRAVLKILSRLQLHVGNDVIAELRALDLRRAFHQTREVVGHALGRDRAVEAFENQIRGFHPVHVAEHHLTAQ